LEPEHIWCYALTIEEGTPFGKRVARGTLLPLADDVHADLMDDADTALRAAGLERYEISNWARSGKESSHNQNYWRGGDYLAAGCGAHGHRGGVRWWNERDTQKYIDLVLQGQSPRAGDEKLSPRQRWNEIVMLGVRTREGFAPSQSAVFGLDARAEWNGALSNLLGQGILREDGEQLVLSQQAFAIADAVAAQLLV
jgi:oxygen-independent coproporphyrinogen-3 oxidase